MFHAQSTLHCPLYNLVRVANLFALARCAVISHVCVSVTRFRVFLCIFQAACSVEAAEGVAAAVLAAIPPCLKLGPAASAEE